MILLQFIDPARSGVQGLILGIFGDAENVYHCRRIESYSWAKIK